MSQKNNFNKLLDDDIKLLTQTMGSMFIKVCKEKMTKTALDILEEFYNDYPEPEYPLYYHRNHNFFYANNKSFAFKPYSKSSNGNYYGGIRLTPENIPNDYNASPSWVFETVMQGYHGASSILNGNPPRMAWSPYDELYYVRDKIISGEADEIFDEVIKTVKSQKYSILKWR